MKPNPILCCLQCCVLTALALVLCISLVAQAETTIGISTTLSGNASTYGIDVKNALLFANEKLANKKYTLIIEDDRCDGKTAATIAQKFVNIDKVEYVIGFACSSAMLASAPIYERSKVLALATSASAAEISNAGDYIFRTWPSDAHSAELLFEYVSQTHTVFGVLSEETEYAQGLLSGFLSGIDDKKLEVLSENFLSGDSDYRTLLGKMRTKKIQGLFVNSQSERTFLAVLKQLRELRIEVPVYGVYWPGSSSFMKEAKELAEGIIYVDAPTVEEALSPAGMKVYEEYVEKFGPPLFSGTLFATTFEAFRALHLAIESGQEPKDFLYKAKFEGLFGEYRFDRNGDIIGMPLLLKQIRNGKPHRLSVPKKG